MSFTRLKQKICGSVKVRVRCVEAYLKFVKWMVHKFDDSARRDRHTSASKSLIRTLGYDGRFLIWKNVFSILGRTSGAVCFPSLLPCKLVLFVSACGWCDFPIILARSGSHFCDR